MPQPRKKSDLFQNIRTGGLNHRLVIMAVVAIVLGVVDLGAAVICLTRGEYWYALMDFAVTVFTLFAGVWLLRDVKRHS